MSSVACVILPAFVYLIHLSLSHKLEKPSGWQVLDIKPSLCLILHSTTVLFSDVVTSHTLHQVTSSSHFIIGFPSFYIQVILNVIPLQSHALFCARLTKWSNMSFFPFFFWPVNTSNHKWHGEKKQMKMWGLLLAIFPSLVLSYLLTVVQLLSRYAMTS